VQAQVVALSFPGDWLVQLFNPAAGRYLRARGHNVGRVLARAAPTLPQDPGGIITDIAGANILAPVLCAGQQRDSDGDAVLRQFVKVVGAD
jgi:hypothetical protein